jgi:lambda repressor-like predicted transcriptional regulator
VSAADICPRPSREEIAARVSAVTAETGPRQPESDVVAWFSAHARAQLTVRGWSLHDLSERTGDASGNITQAINGTKCPLAIAGRIAGALGVQLAEMVVPYTCRTCCGRPPAGFACLECGTEARTA